MNKVQSQLSPSLSPPPLPPSLSPSLSCSHTSHLSFSLVCLFFFRCCTSLCPTISSLSSLSPPLTSLPHVSVLPPLPSYYLLPHPVFLSLCSFHPFLSTHPPLFLSQSKIPPFHPFFSTHFFLPLSQIFCLALFFPSLSSVHLFLYFYMLHRLQRWK